jgi:hypothetical protein
VGLVAVHAATVRHGLVDHGKGQRLLQVTMAIDAEAGRSLAQQSLEAGGVRIVAGGALSLLSRCVTNWQGQLLLQIVTDQADLLLVDLAVRGESRATGGGETGEQAGQDQRRDSESSLPDHGPSSTPGTSSS